MRQDCVHPDIVHAPEAVPSTTVAVIQGGCDAHSGAGTRVIDCDINLRGDLVILSRNASRLQVIDARKATKLWWCWHLPLSDRACRTRLPSLTPCTKTVFPTRRCRPQRSLHTPRQTTRRHGKRSNESEEHHAARDHCITSQHMHRAQTPRSRPPSCLGASWQERGFTRGLGGLGAGPKRA